MIQCPYCECSLSSEGSYRVHKHRFHKGMEYKQSVVTHEDVQQPTPELQQEQPEPQEPEHHGRSAVERGEVGDGGIGGILAIGGVIAVGIILALFGKKQ